MVDFDPADEQILGVIEKLENAADTAAIQAVIEEHANLLLTGRAAEILEEMAVNLEAESGQSSVNDSQQRRAFAELLRQLQKQLPPKNGFMLTDGQFIDDQRELGLLILRSENQVDPSSLHLLIDGTSWLLRNSNLKSMDELKNTFKGIRANALLARSELGSGSQKHEDLDEAIRSFLLLSKAISPEHDLEGYTVTYHNLAKALLLRAEKQLGSAAIDDLNTAIESCKTALKLTPSQQYPQSYVQILMNAANAFVRRAERCAGRIAMNDLNQSLKYYDDALEILALENTTHGYVSAQMNRSVAFLRRAEQRSGQAALEDLTAAIASSDAALATQGIENEPKRYSFLQSNRAGALMRRAERSSGRASLTDADEAIAALDLALKRLAEDYDSVRYLSILANRSTALMIRAQNSPRGSAIHAIDDAIAGFGETLEHLTRDTQPVEYANSILSLATAIMRKSYLQSGQAALKSSELAIQAYEHLSDLLTPDHDPQNYAYVQMNWAVALARQAECQSGDAALRSLGDAIVASETALSLLSSEHDPQHHAEVQMNRANAARTLADRSDIGTTRRREAFCLAEKAARAALLVWTAETTISNYLLAQRYLATACRGLGDVGGERAALEGALGAGRRGILGSSDASERTLLAQRVAGLGDALGLLRLRSEDNAAAALAAIGTGRGVQLSADLVMARLEVDPDLVPLREALRALQAAREDLARVEREVMVLRGRVEQSRRMMERSDDESMATEVLDEAEFAQSQLSDLQVQHATALSKFEAARSAYESGLSAAGLGLDPEPPSMEEIVDTLPEGGVLAVPIPGADGDGGALLIVGRGPDGTPDAAWSELPSLSQDATRALLFGESWTEGCDDKNLAPGWFEAYNDLKGRLATSGGVASPHGPTQTALDRDVRAMGRRLWDLIMGPLDHALRAFGAIPGAEVVMMPPGRLAALPLAAAHPEPEIGTAIRPFLTDWALSLVPSPQALIAAAGRISALDAKLGTQAARLLCVTTPKEFAPNPVADLVPRGTCREIEGPDATPEEVRTALEGYRHVAFLCHGLWNPQEPESSGLALAGPLDTAGRETVAMLTVGDLQRPGAAKGNARSWLMMACETAPVGLDAPDEFAGLAVRLAGEVPAVTGTLYPVLMGHAAPMGRAVLALQMGPRRLSPAQALRRAQLTAMEGGTPALEALAAEAIGPAQIPQAPSATNPAAMPLALSNQPEMALGMPRDEDARALFDDYEDEPSTNEPAEELRTDGPDPDDWTIHSPAHWAAYTTYGQ